MSKLKKINWDSMSEDEKKEFVKKVQARIMEENKELFQKLAAIDSCCGKGCCHVDNKDREEN